MKKIGISTFALQSKYGDERALEICAEAGFVSIDFNMRKFDKNVVIAVVDYKHISYRCN